ncbi:MAG TPA: hypothetical protein VNI84_21110 [Pyrinomonadaceae bacterium]|nr:hypothetical protein [Pyrinomonadaceae bacterium]
MWTEENERLIRNWLTVKITETANVVYAISDPVYFTGKEDFAGQMGIFSDLATDEANFTAFQNLNCDFVMTTFVRFDDTGKGTRQCPVMLLTYEFLVFQEMRKGLENDTNLHNRHIATINQIWRKFLTGHVFQADPIIRHLALEQIGATARNAVNEHLPGVNGYYSILQTKVEVA